MKDKKKKETTDLQRRSLLKNTAAATLGLGALNAVSGPEAHAEEIIQPRAPIPEIVQQAARPTVRESVKITRLAHGVPVGGELDYLDEGTLSQALKARTAL